MPRPTKTFRRQKINASIAYKRGDRATAYKLWAQASAGYNEHRNKKRNKNKPAEEAAAGEAATAEGDAS